MKLLVFFYLEKRYIFTCEDINDILHSADIIFTINRRSTQKRGS